MTQVRPELSVRKLTEHEMRERGDGGRARGQKSAKLDYTDVEPLGYGLGVYASVGHIGVLTAPSRSYLSITATGSPRRSEDYRVAANALYAAAYGVKVHNKTLLRSGLPGAGDQPRCDYLIAPLERLRGPLTAQATDEASWTLLLRLPTWIDDAEIGDALEHLEFTRGIKNLARVHRRDLPAVSYLQTRVDGRWSAALTPTAKAFDVHLREHGLTAGDGQWHEVCLGEPGAPVGQSSYLLRRPLA